MKNYQLDFCIPEILPFLISFKKICLEKEVKKLIRDLLIVFKQIFDIDILEFFFDKFFNFKKAFHLNKLKKLRFLNINFKINCSFSVIFKFKRNFLSFGLSFFIYTLLIKKLSN